MKCAANDAAVWTYGQRLQGVVPRRRDEKAISVWTRTADGSCTSDFELPLDYLPPVRVRRLPLLQVAGLAGGGGGGFTHPRGFHVQLVGRRLVYAKEECQQADVETPFFLHVVPARDDFDTGGVGFENLDFLFKRYGNWSGKDGFACVANVPLPEYAIAEVRTGQYTSAGKVWESKFRSQALLH